MCFSPKVKMPKVNTQQMRAPDPAPLAAQVQGVQFGGSGSSEDDEETGKETSSEVKTSKKSGKSSLKIELSSKDGSSSKGGAKRSSVKSRMGK